MNAENVKVGMKFRYTSAAYKYYLAAQNSSLVEVGEIVEITQVCADHVHYSCGGVGGVMDYEDVGRLLVSVEGAVSS